MLGGLSRDCACKALSKIIERIIHFVGVYQGDFQSVKLTINQIFSVKQILGKS